MPDLKSKLQHYGREELYSAVAEAMRKMRQVQTRTCDCCEHYNQENNWCNEFSTSTEKNDSCDKYSEC